MSLSRGRRRITINGATLSRAQTITFERQTASGDCFTASDGTTRCKNENKGTFLNRDSFIEPSKAKPTKADEFKSISEIEPNCFTSSDGTKICKDDKGKNVDIETGVRQGDFFKGVIDLNPAATALLKRFGKDPVETTLKIKDDSIQLFLDNENKVRAAIVIADAIALGLMAVGGVIVATTAATGVGAAVGGAIAGTGAGLSFGATKAEQALDRLDKTRRALQQLEDAVEVAKQTVEPKVDRGALIAENKEAIDNRVEELLEMTKGNLQSRAEELGLTGVSLLRKADLAKEVAEFEIIGAAGKEKVEPKVGRSKLRSTLEKIAEVVDRKLDEKEEVKAVMDEFDVDEDEAKRLLKVHKLGAELDAQKKSIEREQAKKQERLDEVGKDILDKKARQEKVDEIARLLGLTDEQAEALFIKKEIKDKLEKQKQSDLTDEKDLLALQKELAEILGIDEAERQEQQRGKIDLDSLIDPDVVSDPSEPSDEFSEELGVPDAQQIRLPANIIGGRPNTAGIDLSEKSENEFQELALLHGFSLTQEEINDLENGEGRFAKQRAFSKKLDTLQEENPTIKAAWLKYIGEAPIPPNLDPSPFSPTVKSPKKKPQLFISPDFVALLEEAEESAPSVASSREPFVGGDITPKVKGAIGLDIKELDSVSEFSSEVSKPKPLRSPLEPQRDPTRQFISPDFIDILDDASEEPRTKSEKVRDCARNLSSVSNEDIINQASRRKLEAAAKTDLVNFPTNFNNPQNMKPEQVANATGTNPIARQRAATLHANEGENIYNKLVRELTQAEDCRAFLTANKAKIAILPKDIFDELKAYCECIMDDDEE